MSKKYTQQDILEMAVRLQDPDLSADMDKDGKITAEDARLAPDGVEIPDPAETVSHSLLERLMEEQNFGYDYDADPLFQQYRDIYEKAGSRAAENAYGLAATYTGGYGSSYAATAANDAYALYMDKLAAKGAELEQKAYDRSRDSRADLYKLYSAAKEQEEQDYRRERDEKEDAYRDREFALKAQNAEQDRRSDLIKFAFDAAEMGDASYLATLGVDPTALQEKDAREKAAFYAKYGDLSELEKLGLDLSSLGEQSDREKAAFYAKYGDWSELEKLGLDIAALQEERDRETAAFYAKYGDLSGLAAQGVDVSRLQKDQLFDIAALYAKYGNFSLLNMLI